MPVGLGRYYQMFLRDFPGFLVYCIRNRLQGLLNLARYVFMWPAHVWVGYICKYETLLVISRREISLFALLHFWMNYDSL